MSQQKTAGANAACVAGMGLRAECHSGSHGVGAEIQRDALLVQYQHALADLQTIHPHGK